MTTRQQSSAGERPTRRRGFVTYDRRIWDDDYLAERLPWPRRYALMWLIQYAQFRRRQKGAVGVRVVVERGQFVASTRRLARQFHWSNPKVNRFLAELCCDHTLCLEGVTPLGKRYRFENYEAYNPRRQARGTPSVTPRVREVVTRRKKDITTLAAAEGGPQEQSARPSVGRSVRETWATPFFRPLEEALGRPLTDPERGQVVGILKSLIDQYGHNVEVEAWRGWVRETRNPKYLTAPNYRRQHDYYVRTYAVVSDPSYTPAGFEDERWVPMAPSWPEGWQKRDGRAA